MTMVNGQRDNGATADATDLSDADAALLARADWHASGGTLTGRQLAERYGRSARWGQKQRAAAEREAAERAAAGTVAVPRTVPRPERKRTPAARTAAPAGASPLVRAVTFVAVGTVLVVAAVVSYVHIRHLAQTAGMGSLAGWLPFALDGMVLACTGFLLDGPHPRKVDVVIARAGLFIGLVSSIAANALAVDPELASPRAVRLALAVYPPLAVAVTGHLALRMRGDR
jgi:Protein of unknown function (DUF2637)